MIFRNPKVTDFEEEKFAFYEIPNVRYIFTTGSQWRLSWNETNSLCIIVVYFFKIMWDFRPSPSVICIYFASIPRALFTGHISLLSHAPYVPGTFRPLWLTKERRLILFHDFRLCVKYRGDRVKEDVMGDACSMKGEKQNIYKLRS
jgi:hypothetical protein